MKCSSCGFDQSEHHYNGACYGVCGEFTLAPMKLSERALIHADNMQSEGWYTTANVLAACAEALDAAEAMKAATLSNVGHIEKARQHATANSALQIELACSKILEAVRSFDGGKL